jgi:ATP-dependent exoDNAse (exonuclease V) alpha subunit
MTYVQLKLAFARTLHKTQGKEAGENKEIIAIVFSPGSSSFESINPGTLYTGISRASSIGNGDIEKSSIYFSGKDCTTSRFTDVKNKRTSERIKYNRVSKRENWINHLKKILH